MAKRINALTITQTVALVPGTERSLYIQWAPAWPKANYNKYLDTYRVSWAYWAGAAGPFVTTSDTNVTTAQWSAPENATTVQASVQAISKSIKVGKKTHNSPWIGNVVSAGEFNCSGFVQKEQALQTPGAPTVVCNNYQITATVTGYNDDRCQQIRFQIFEDGNSVLVADYSLAAGRAKTGIIGAKAGSVYTARAMAVQNGPYTASGWSGYATEVTVSNAGSGGTADPYLPTTPSTPTVTINQTGSTHTFEARVDNYVDSRSTGGLQFQIVRADSGVVKTQTVGISHGSASVTFGPVDVNVNYKARVRAVRSGYNSLEWSAYSSNIKYAAEKPTTPATPTVTISGRTLTAAVENYNNVNVDYIYFQVIRNNSGSVYKAGQARISTGRAAFVVPNIIIGSEYKARAYAIGVRDLNKGLNSEWSAYSANVKTVPGNVAKFTSISAISSTGIRVTWNKAEAAEDYIIEYTYNHENLTYQQLFASNVDVTRVDGIKSLFYPVLNLEMGKTYYFRIKAHNSAGESEAWSAVSSCVIGTTPDAPTTWSYTTVGIIGDNIIFNWIHNTQDSADQTGARIYIKIVASNGTVKRASSIYATINGKTSTYTYSTSSLADGDTVYWRVSTRGTRGITNEWGALSTERSIKVYTRPTLSLSAGEAGSGEIPVISSFPINIQMTALPTTQTPIAYYVKVIANSQYDVSQSDGVEVHVSEGEAIYQIYIPAEAGDSNVRTLTLNPGDLYLVSGVTYTITATVTMSNGLDADDGTVVSVELEASNIYPDADVEIDERTMSATIMPYILDPYANQITTGYLLAIYRMDYDGTFTLIQNGIPVGEGITVFDLHPPLDYARYRIVATSQTTGIVSFDDVESVNVGINAIVIQWGGVWKTLSGVNPDNWYDIDNTWAGTFLALPYNVDVSDEIVPDVALVEYIGRRHPVAYYGTQEGFTSSWDAEIKKEDTETLQKIRALSTYKGDVYVREPNGTGYWANVKISYSITHNSPTIPVSFDISRVEGGA